MSAGAEMHMGKKLIERDYDRFKLLFTNSRPHIPGGELKPLKIRTTRSLIGERLRALLAAAKS